MAKLLWVSVAVAGYAWLPAELVGAGPGPSPEAVRSAVTKALPLIQKSASEYTTHRECFSCHHQALPILAMTTARSRGFKVSDEVLRQQVAHTEKFLASNRDGYQKGRGQGGQADTAGYALWALDAGGWKPDATTAAVAEYLLLRNKNFDHWKTTSRRPPSEFSEFTTTFLAVRGLKTFGTAAQKERIEKRLSEARQWLGETPAGDTEDRVFRLRALRLVGAGEKEVRAAAADLRKTQRPDGGWGQTGEPGCDAYATGSALLALHQAGAVPVTDASYQRGLSFLIKTQRGDGSWLVASRSKPFQTYFETGFPHGKDQFISMSATSWATAALALAIPPADTGISAATAPQ